MSTACRSVPGERLPPFRSSHSVNRLKIGIIPAADQLYLPPQAQTPDQRLVARLIFLLQIIQQTAPPPHQHQQTAA
jgi:hypothetical protein